MVVVVVFEIITYTLVHRGAFQQLLTMYRQLLTIGIYCFTNQHVS